MHDTSNEMRDKALCITNDQLDQVEHSAAGRRVAWVVEQMEPEC
jgi:hypothetical protein